MTARFAPALLILLVPFSFCVAQEHAAAPSQSDAQPEKTQPEPAPPAAAHGRDSTKPAAEGHGEEGGDPHAEFKYSPMVRKLAERSARCQANLKIMRPIFRLTALPPFSTERADEAPGLEVAETRTEVKSCKMA